MWSYLQWAYFFFKSHERVLDHLVNPFPVEQDERSLSEILLDAQAFDFSVKAMFETDWKGRT